MLSDLPIGLTVAGVVFDIVGLLLRSGLWAFAANVSLGAAFLGGCAAALVGWWDYQTVPRDHPARRTGALHGYLNLSALIALLFSLLNRWLTVLMPSSIISVPLLGSALALLALVLLSLAGWYGGELVFHLGWRVTPAEHAEILEEELHQSGQDAQIEKVHAIVQQYKQE